MSISISNKKIIYILEFPQGQPRISPGPQPRIAKIHAHSPNPAPTSTHIQDLLDPQIWLLDHNSFQFPGLNSIHDSRQSLQVLVFQRTHAYRLNWYLEQDCPQRISSGLLNNPPRHSPSQLNCHRSIAALLSSSSHKITSSIPIYSRSFAGLPTLNLVHPNTTSSNSRLLSNNTSIPNSTNANPTPFRSLPSSTHDRPPINNQHHPTPPFPSLPKIPHHTSITPRTLASKLNLPSQIEVYSWYKPRESTSNPIDTWSSTRLWYAGVQTLLLLISADRPNVTFQSNTTIVETRTLPLGSVFKPTSQYGRPAWMS